MNVESEEGMPMSIHFNPFSYIRNESDIMSIAGILMKSTTPQDEAGGGNDQFFEQSAELLLQNLHFVVDVDITGFFDNIDHSSEGYTRQQIKLLHKFIMQDFTAEQIMKIIPPSSEMNKIKNLLKNF